MEVSRLENLPPPPGIINSIKAGFDAIASHSAAMFLPLFFNLLMWLGPRLRVDELFGAFLLRAIPIWRRSGVPVPDIQRLVDLFEATIPSFNLLWLFRTLPIGISSLLLPREASSTPLGDPVVWQAGAWSLPLWVLLLTLAGWAAGAAYFRSVAWIVVPPVDGNGVGIFNAILQTGLISIGWNLFLVVVGAPVFMTMGLVMQLNVILGNLLALFISLISVWVIVPMFFLPHGVFMRGQTAFASLMSSLRLTRFTLPTSSLFVLAVFLLAVGLNYLWLIPPEDSWLTLLGIFGHSFVTTALLAASFIYYRDMNEWLKQALERLRPSGESLA